MVANPARDQLDRENVFPCASSRLRIWSRETGSAVTSRDSPLILHSQAESACSPVPLIPPAFSDDVHVNP